jgi:hypothetical protein
MADFCRALFPLLVAHADDHGRLPGDELTVKLQVDPISPRKIDDFTTALHALHEVGLITWYEVGDRKVIEIVQFSAHQDLKGHDKRPPKLPACPDADAMIGRSRRHTERPIKPAVGKSGDIWAETGTQLKVTEENLTELKGREGKGSGATPRPTPDDLQAVWNATRSPGPKVEDLTPDRRKRYSKALETKPNLHEWELVIRWINAQPWANAPGTGEHANWRATLDWLVKPGKLGEYLERANTDAVTSPRLISQAGSTTKAAAEVVKAALRSKQP